MKQPNHQPRQDTFFYNGWAQNSYTFRIGVLRPNLCNEALRLTVGTTGIA